MKYKVHTSHIYISVCVCVCRETTCRFQLTLGFHFAIFCGSIAFCLSLAPVAHEMKQNTIEIQIQRQIEKDSTQASVEWEKRTREIKMAHAHCPYLHQQNRRPCVRARTRA